MSFFFFKCAYLTHHLGESIKLMYHVDVTYLEALSWVELVWKSLQLSSIAGITCTWRVNITVALIKRKGEPKGLQKATVRRASQSRDIGGALPDTWLPLPLRMLVVWAGQERGMETATWGVEIEEGRHILGRTAPWVGLNNVSNSTSTLLSGHVIDWHVNTALHQKPKRQWFKAH